MSPDHWQRVRDLLDEALKRDTDTERRAYLEEAAEDPRLARDARSLLVAIDQAESFIEEPAIAGLAVLDKTVPDKTVIDKTVPNRTGETGPGSEALAQDPEDGSIPERIGVYGIEKLLGEGGMGRVYLATRDDEAFRKRVAIKVLKLGMDTTEIVRRFESERQILANLPHPNIAQILDGGRTDDGRPFLVMEYVEGEPLDLYCRTRQLGLRARIEIFRDICAAVQFAHQNLVIHRDLKPANVLVTADGAPKLLDFGIAKLLRPETFPRTVAQTAAGKAFMTPEYASPEQVLGEGVTTISDVYSLGVMLFELLTGRRPFDFQSAPGAFFQAAQGVEAERPSSVVGQDITKEHSQTNLPESTDRRRLRRRLRGDLDNIVLKSLQRDPRRRYGSAEQLAEDLDRYLDGRPVRARPDTFAYRASKLIRRHKAAVSATALLVVLALAFTIALFIEQRRTLDQRDRAELVSEILTDVFALPDPVRARGESITAREILDRGTAHIESKIAERPELRSDLGLTLGRTYMNLGLYPEARAQLEGAVQSLKTEGNRPERLADALAELAAVRGLENELLKATQLAKEALAWRREVHGRRLHASVIHSRVQLAQLAEQSGAYQRSREGYELALAEARELGDAETIGLVLDRYGQLLIRIDQDQEAEARLREALDQYRSLGPDHPEVPTAMSNLATAIWNDHPEEAEELLRSALDIQKATFKEARPSLADTTENLAHLLQIRGRFDEAEPLYTSALQLQKEVYGPDHPKTARTLNKIGWTQAKLGHRDKAEALLRRALAIQEAALGPEHAETANTLSNLGQVLNVEPRLDEAEEMLQRALQATEKALGGDHERVGIVLNALARIAQARGDLDQAEALLSRAIAILRAGNDVDSLVAALVSQAGLLHLQEREQEARDHFAEAKLTAEKYLGFDHFRVDQIAVSLAQAENRLGRYSEAELLARKAYEGLQKSFAPESAWPAAARRELAIGLKGQDKFAEAEPLMVADFEQHLDTLGSQAERTQKALARLIGLYERWGRESEVARLRTMEVTP